MEAGLEAFAQVPTDVAANALIVPPIIELAIAKPVIVAMSV